MVALLCLYWSILTTSGPLANLAGAVEGALGFSRGLREVRVHYGLSSLRGSLIHGCSGAFIHNWEDPLTSKKDLSERVRTVMPAP